MHLNDTETADAERWARTATAIAGLRERGQCDLVVHAGDVVLGGADGLERVRILNRLGLEILAPGNHDLDHGLPALGAQLRSLAARPVCANLTGTPYFAPYRVLRRQRLRVALTGVIMGDLALYQRQGNLDGVTVVPPAEALARLVPELRRQADLVVVLSHCGYEADLTLAAAVPGIDVIIGGHSHHALPEPVLVGATAIVQAGAYCDHVGWVAAAPGERARGGLIATAELTPEPGVLALALPPMAGGAELPVGRTETDLRSDEYASETPLGNLMADVVRQAAGTDLALLRCAGVNNGFPPGPLTRSDVGALCHVGEDRVARVELTGAELRAVLECGARDRYYLLTLSGGTVTYDGARPEGERVVQVTVGGAPLAAEAVYSVACTEIMARGACGFTPLLGKPFDLTPHTINELMLRHVEQAGTIRPEPDGRLLIYQPIPATR